MKYLLVGAVALLSFSALGSDVKLSRSGICHDESSSSYTRTVHYTAYGNVEDCLAAGGRLPKSKSAKAPVVGYDRSAFSHWSGSCPNTRHKLLAELSTATTTYTRSDGCTVARGRWFDEYGGDYHYVARDLDVDHVVPLAYSWSRGSHAWSAEKREQFANDPANLVITTASLNREKGAKGPTEWLPPRRGYRCQYITRFQRVTLKYGLQLSASEKARIAELRAEYCGG